MTKKKKITIVIIVAAVLLVGYLALAVVVPRVMLHLMIKKTLGGVGSGAEYFTEYSAAYTGGTITAENGHIIIDIPETCLKQEEFLETAQLFKEENKHMVIMMNSDELTDMNLLDPENFDSSDYKVKIGLKDLTKGFEGFGNGLPDSAYGTFKCAYMLDEEDYNPMSLKNQVAYSVIGVLKTILSVYGEVRIYERDNICGFVTVRENAEPEKEGAYTVSLEIYTKDNLNKSTMVMVTTNNLDEAFALINSARPAV